MKSLNKNRGINITRYYTIIFLKTQKEKENFGIVKSKTQRPPYPQLYRSTEHIFQLDFRLISKESVRFQSGLNTVKAQLIDLKRPINTRDIFPFSNSGSLLGFCYLENRDAETAEEDEAVDGSPRRRRRRFES